MVKNCDLLAERLREKSEKGLVDVKFFLRNTSEAVAEEVCQEVLSLYTAVDNGEVAPLDFKRRRS